MKTTTMMLMLHWAKLADFTARLNQASSMDTSHDDFTEHCKQKLTPNQHPM